MAMTTELTTSELKARLEALGLFGLIACCDEIIDKPWLRDVLAIEERERQKRGLEQRARDARVGAAKPMADFDWAWPRKILSRTHAPRQGPMAASLSKPLAHGRWLSERVPTSTWPRS
jgi:hypothetical protein